MVDIPKVYEFQTSVETLRAHHWRSFTDAYAGCAFNCQYCLYKGPEDYGMHVRPTSGFVEANPRIGILDVGTTTDPYQPIEAQQRRTRRVLEAALQLKIPVFLLTRGTMVTRDADVLQALSGQGLVEVCFSIITLNERLARKLEVRAPSPSERLQAARELARLGVPVTFHVAPVIPGLNSGTDMELMGFELGSVSGRHVFAAMLGAQKAFWETFYNVMEGAAPDCHSIEVFRAAYPRAIEFARGSAVTCDHSTAAAALGPLRNGVTRAGTIFVSENYPYLSTGALEGGIYRWKLPTVYDMAAWIGEQAGQVGWIDFYGWYQRFRPGQGLTALIGSLWKSGELFLGTNLARVGTDHDVRYVAAPDTVLTPAGRTLVAKRRSAS